MEEVRLAEQLGQMNLEHLKELYRLGESLTVQGEEGVLFCLYHARRSMLPGEIMARMGLTTGRVANILRQLEGKGLILRMQDAGDRRRVHVSLTEQGEALANRRYLEFTRRHQALLSYLGDADAREMLRLMQRCLSYFRAQPES